MAKEHEIPQTQMKQLQELLQNAELRHKVQSASDEHTAAKLLSDAAASKGYALSKGWIKQVFDDVKLARLPASLSDRELQDLASTFRMADTPPKLCHTDSCGGNHPGCC